MKIGKFEVFHVNKLSMMSYLRRLYLLWFTHKYGTHDCYIMVPKSLIIRRVTLQVEGGSYHN